MTEQAKLALSESIEHWVRMRDGKEWETESPNGLDCALCLVHDSIDECCSDDTMADAEVCPIVVHTQRIGCEGTPFFDARREWKLRKFGAKHSSFPAAAQSMIDFLREVQKANQ